MAKLKIDELNTLSASDEPFDYEDYIEHYFDVMQISEKQKKERIEAAEELFDIILYFLIWCEEFPEKVALEETEQQFENNYKEVVYQYSEPDNYINNYVPLFVNNLIKTTLEHQGEKYFTSVERAASVAVNESNTILNHGELVEAVENGYLYKEWVAELDNRTRFDHAYMDGTIIPINEFFIFPDCIMDAPHDEVNGTPSQLVNCRCSLRFLKAYSSGARSELGITEKALLDGKKAAELYKQIINRKKEYEIAAVAEHSGYSYEDIEKIYEHVFIRNHLFTDGTVHKFIPDLDMANSWLRIRNGNPLEHDLVLLRHEYEEEKIMGNGLDFPYEKAHHIVVSMGKDFDYDFHLEKYLLNRKKK